MRKALLFRTGFVTGLSFLKGHLRVVFFMPQISQSISSNSD